uniref:Peptidase S1 domain-containing protein n=1 Tax=Myripristis murdjan TaxID=586833 RepID=A0A667ZIY5_9TELE
MLCSHDRPQWGEAHPNSVDVTPSPHEPHSADLGLYVSFWRWLVASYFIIKSCVTLCYSIKKVSLGVHSIQNKNKEPWTIRKVKAFPHPCYDDKEMVNDLMLLKLDKAVKETKAVKFLPVLRELKEPQPGSKCLVAGWGKTTNLSKKMSDVLMAANVTVVNRVKCNSPEYYNYNPIITHSMLCAGPMTKKREDYFVHALYNFHITSLTVVHVYENDCHGDSGGPLQCNGVLVGVTSFGKRCGVMPGVYSFLSERQITWIHKTIKK